MIFAYYSWNFGYNPGEITLYGYTSLYLVSFGHPPSTIWVSPLYGKAHYMGNPLVLNARKEIRPPSTIWVSPQYGYPLYGWCHCTDGDGMVRYRTSVQYRTVPYDSIYRNMIMHVRYGTIRYDTEIRTCGTVPYRYCDMIKLQWVWHVLSRCESQGHLVHSRFI